MSTLFDRPLFDVTLPDGRACKIHRLGGSEFTEALKRGREHDDTLSHNVAYWSTICLYGVADPKPESIEQVGALLSVGDLEFIAKRIEYRSDLGPDPDAAEDAPSELDEVSIEEKEAPIDDPLVDEFPRTQDQAQSRVDSEAGALSGVPVPAVSARGAGEPGSAADDGRGTDSSTETDRAEGHAEAEVGVTALV